MLGLISFIAVIVGAINWFCIGLLQFDFVAGLFGSQSSIFSRIVYIAVGLGALILLFNLIENKGKIKFNFKKKQQKQDEIKQYTYHSEPKYAHQTEAGNDYHYDNKHTAKQTSEEEHKNNNCDNGSCPISQDNTQNETPNNHNTSN